MTIWMLHTTTKLLEICIDINFEISEVEHYTWLALEITSLCNKYFFLQMAYKLLSQTGVPCFSWKYEDWQRIIPMQNCPVKSQCQGK